MRACAVLFAVACTQSEEPNALVLRDIEMNGIRIALNGTELSGTDLGRVSSDRPPLVACKKTTEGLDRECGWTFAGLGRCRPGTTVEVGASAACGLGSCDGDSILRVCRGDSACAHGSARILAENDDACGGDCSKATFRCPPGGTYTVLAANYSSADAAAVRVVASAGTFPIVREVRGAAFKGATLSGLDASGKPAYVRISDVVPDPKDPEKEVSLYTVLVQEGSNWTNLCKPDVEHVSKAIPLQGIWDESGKHIESDSITFACTSGVIGKCVRWGYKPWKTVRGRSLAAFHQACTRMARADYCGVGKPHTRDGTPIDLYDSVDVQRREASSGMTFEAVWGPSGALCVNRARWFETLAELLAECPGKLKTGEDGKCGSSEEARKNWPSALLFNDSFSRKPEKKRNEGEHPD